MRSTIAWLCLLVTPAAGGESVASLSVASEQAWSGLAGTDLVSASPSTIEVQAGIGVMRWLSLDALLLWSRDDHQVAAGARLSLDPASLVMRARRGGGMEVAAGTALGDLFELELGMSRGDTTEVLLKAVLRY